MTSSPEQNKGLVRRHFEEAYNERRPHLWDELLEGGYTVHPAFGPPGRDGYRDGCAAWWVAFPDTQIEILDLIAEDDRVAARWVERGTNTGEFSGMAPTGRTLELEGMSVFRVRDGRLAEVWFQHDALAHPAPVRLGRRPRSLMPR